jgi:hypothetical protein
VAILSIGDDGWVRFHESVWGGNWDGKGTLFIPGWFWMFDGWYRFSVVIVVYGLEGMHHV